MADKVALDATAVGSFHVDRFDKRREGTGDLGLTRPRLVGEEHAVDEAEGIESEHGRGDVAGRHRHVVAESPSRCPINTVIELPSTVELFTNADASR